MIVTKINIEPYLIKFNQKSYPWHLFEFLLSPSTQAYWCHQWKKHPVVITLTLPASLTSQINAITTHGKFKETLAAQLKKILTHYQVVIITIQINSQRYYLNHNWCNTQLQRTNIFLIIIIIVLTTSLFLLAHQQQQYNQKIQNQHRRYQIQQATKIKKNKSHNETIMNSFKKYITIPQLYTQSIQISAQKIKLKGIYNAQYENELLTKLWQSQKIQSQNYHITPLKNNWKKINYTWHYDQN